MLRLIIENIAGAVPTPYIPLEVVFCIPASGRRWATPISLNWFGCHDWHGLNQRNLIHNSPRSPTRQRVFNRKNSYRLACCSTESVQQSKVSFRRFGTGMLNRNLRPHQIGSAFLCYFLLQRQKKVDYLSYHAD